ncbi:MAG: hypothetical protein WBQ60_12690 [Asticcacaulis sp.]
MDLIRNPTDEGRDERLDVALRLLKKPAHHHLPGSVPLLAGVAVVGALLFLGYVTTDKPDMIPAVKIIQPVAASSAGFELSGQPLSAEPVTDAVVLSDSDAATVSQ